MGYTLDTTAKLQKLMSTYPVSFAMEYDPDEEVFHVSIKGEAGLQGHGRGQASTIISAIGRALRSMNEQLDAEYGAGGKRGA